MTPAWLTASMPHLIVVPILLPLVSAALLLLLGERRRPLKVLVNLVASALGLAVAVALLAWVDARSGVAAVGIYLPSNWPVPFGIVLALDRLSALMLVLTAAIGFAAALYSIAGWHRAGVNFHPLFQLQLMGLNGAFLTADLFNLFVFFEVMLAASYGLLLHGSGRARVRAGLHYIAVNLLASSLFLIGVAMLYGVTGTLNMADIAQKLGDVPAADRGLLHAGAAILGIAFLAKAALWPLNFWLTPAYDAASAPAAAMFALLTKVGVYAVLRLWTLFFPAGSASALFGADALVWGGLATLGFGALGVLASQRLGRLAGYSLIVSSGTLLAAIGFGRAAITGGALYYLLSSTLAASALFLLIELIERSRQFDPVLPGDEPIESRPFGLELPEAGINLDEQEQALIGQAIPAALAFLGICFTACSLLLAGLPPLSGFIAKFAILSALLDGGAVPRAGWLLLGLPLASGLAALVALSRSGIRTFWAPQQRTPPRLRVIECLPIGLLLLACALLTVRAEPVLRYADMAARALHDPRDYIAAVLMARPHAAGLAVGARP
jgi:multicomponent K+:H+ antiporter subunit D